MRAIAAYYASKPDVHPNPSETMTFYVMRDSGTDKKQLLEYVGLRSMIILSLFPHPS